MKQNKIQNKKLNLNKQVIQKLDSQKLAGIHAGEATGITTIVITDSSNGSPTILNSVCDPSPISSTIIVVD